MNSQDNHKQGQGPAQEASSKACAGEQSSADAAATAGAENSLFSPEDVIHSYTRAQAIADGYLVDVTEIAKEAGFKVPVALTRAVWTDCVEWSEETRARKPGTGQDEDGRLWDVVWMASNAAKAAAAHHSTLRSVVFDLYRVPVKGNGRTARRMQLRLHSGPGDAGEHVMTITLPDED